jgi:hypothetical protein
MDLSTGETMQYGVCLWSAGNSSREVTQQIFVGLEDQQPFAAPRPEMQKLAVDPYLRIIGAKNAFAAATVPASSPRPCRPLPRCACSPVPAAIIAEVRASAPRLSCALPVLLSCLPWVLCRAGTCNAVMPSRPQHCTLALLWYRGTWWCHVVHWGTGTQAPGCSMPKVDSSRIHPSVLLRVNA